jgi:hypothetical protein
MLDAFLNTLVKNASDKKAEDELTKIMMTLPIAEIQKIASLGSVTQAYCADGDDGKWLSKYEGTPLYDRALGLAQDLLAVEGKRIQKRLERSEPEPEDLYAQEDMVRLKKRQLDLELSRANNSADSGDEEGVFEEEEPEEKDEEHVPDVEPQGKAVTAEKKAAACFVDALIKTSAPGITVKPIVPVKMQGVSAPSRPTPQTVTATPMPFTKVKTAGVGMPITPLPRPMVAPRLPVPGVAKPLIAPQQASLPAPAHTPAPAFGSATGPAGAVANVKTQPIRSGGLLGLGKTQNTGQIPVAQTPAQAGVVSPAQSTGARLWQQAQGSRGIGGKAIRFAGRHPILATAGGALAASALTGNNDQDKQASAYYADLTGRALAHIGYKQEMAKTAEGENPLDAAAVRKSVVDNVYRNSVLKGKELTRDQARNTAYLATLLDQSFDKGRAAYDTARSPMGAVKGGLVGAGIGGLGGAALGYFGSPDHGSIGHDAAVDNAIGFGAAGLGLGGPLGAGIGDAWNQIHANSVGNKALNEHAKTPMPEEWKTASIQKAAEAMAKTALGIMQRVKGAIRGAVPGAAAGAIPGLVGAGPIGAGVGALAGGVGGAISGAING